MARSHAIVPGSDRRPVPGATATGKPDLNEEIEVTLKVRRKNKLPDLRGRPTKQITRQQLAARYGGSNADIAKVEKTREQTSNIGGGWHTDHSYDLEPALGSILVARDLPPSGGDTLFADMYAAWDTLPAELQDRVRHMQAIHSTALAVLHHHRNNDEVHLHRNRVGAVHLIPR